MDILRIATAGSVDDGKSTLIGRLLFETQSITKDKIEALKAASQRKGLDFVDLSLLTDGLIAEREQGITIDVAHIYFNTPNRKYIIADTPGHIEYTRNMVTGASNAAVSIILCDARSGVSEQTKRHLFISEMLQIKHVIVAVNKMDLIDYDQVKFEAIKANFQEISKKINANTSQVSFIPLSSLYGENMVETSAKMPWYTGTSLLSLLENIEINDDAKNKRAFRLPVQYVIRPKSEEYHDFRGYAGKIASGTVKVGDTLLALPSGRSSVVTAVLKNNIDIHTASEDESVVISLADDIDVSRGDMLVHEQNKPEQTKEISAQVCWMDSTPLVVGKTYLLQQGVRRVRAKVSSLDEILDIKTMEYTHNSQELGLNSIGTVNLRLSSELFIDKYTQNPKNGAFIFIDESTNSTVGVGFVR
jgi:sulfate adenylyltransferase subunit 1